MTLLSAGHCIGSVMYAIPLFNLITIMHNIDRLSNSFFFISLI